MAVQKQDDQHERTFSSYVRIQVVVLKTYLGRWTIGRSGERGSGISVLPARYDDDDVDDDRINLFRYLSINCSILVKEVISHQFAVNDEEQVDWRSLTFRKLAHVLIVFYSREMCDILIVGKFGMSRMVGWKTKSKLGKTRNEYIYIYIYIYIYSFLIFPIFDLWVFSKVSKISWPVHILQQQHLIDRKLCQQKPYEDVKCCWQVIDPIKIWSIQGIKHSGNSWRSMFLILLSVLTMTWSLRHSQNVIFRKISEVTITRSKWLIVFTVNLEPYRSLLHELRKGIVEPPQWKKGVEKDCIGPVKRKMSKPLVSTYARHNQNEK